MRLALSVALALLVTWAGAQEPLPPPEILASPSAQDDEPLALPDIGPEDQMEPEVTIIQRRDATIQEYRLNGRLYMIRVLPRWGFPYYLVPTDVEGVWTTQLDNFAPLVPPQWILFSW